MLSETTIAELQLILEEEFGIKCTRAEAAEAAARLVSLAETLQEIKNKYE